MSHNNTTINGILPQANADIPLTLSSVVPPSGDGVLGFDGTTWSVVEGAVSLDWAHAADIFSRANIGSFSTSTYYYNTTNQWAWIWRAGSSTELLAGGVSIAVATTNPAPLSNGLWGMAIALPAGSYLVRWAINTDTRTSSGDAALRLWLATTSSGATGQYVGNTLRVYSDERHGGHLVAAFTIPGTRFLFARVTSTNGNFSIIDSHIPQKADYINIRRFS